MGNEVIDLTTEEDLDAIAAEAGEHPSPPRALSAQYNRDFDMVIVKVDNGRRLLIPREDLKGLESASAAQLAKVEVRWGADIGWWDLDVHHHIDNLLERYPAERWNDEHSAAA